MRVYEPGCIINRVLTEHRTVQPEQPFTDIHGVQHTAAVFGSWTPEDLAAVGVKMFLEDSIAEGFWPGLPLDIEDAVSVRRTYPAPVEIPGYAANKRKTAIMAELAALDQKRIRPTAEGDTEFLLLLNAKAVALRAELAAL